jgi:hypothetical protein
MCATRRTVDVTCVMSAAGAILRVGVLWCAMSACCSAADGWAPVQLVSAVKLSVNRERPCLCTFAILCEHYEPMSAGHRTGYTIELTSYICSCHSESIATGFMTLAK